jgi:hypothetical protein
MNSIAVKTTGPQSVVLIPRRNGKRVTDQQLKLLIETDSSGLLTHGHVLSYRVSRKGEVELWFNVDPKEGAFGPCSQAVDKLAWLLRWTNPWPAVVVCTCEQCVGIRAQRRSIVCVGDRR